MKRKLLNWISCAAIFCASSAWAEKIYNENAGRIVMEIENTESDYDGWDFYATDAAGYPAGATGTGHLEYKRYGPEGWGKPSSPLVYKFKVNQGGIYRLFLRAHKRLNPGDAGDQHNDCFIRMEGDFVSGSADVALSALQTDSKIYGGDAAVWSRAIHMDAHGADHKAVYYEFKAGEIYTFTISGRSNQFNLDRIVFSHSDYGWPSNSNFEGWPESELNGDPLVNAGDDHTVDLPTAQVLLVGSASDDGSIASYSWTQVVGPNTAILSGAGAAQLTASALVKGTYVFRLTVTDNDSNAVFDEVTVRVRDPSDAVAIIDEDWESIAFGDTTAVNGAITDGSYDAGLRLHNHIIGEIVSPNAAFTTASGSVLEVTTGGNPAGGWGLLSADNSWRDVTLSEGQDIIFAFDAYVMAVPEGTGSIQLKVKLDNGEEFVRNFTEFTGASLGDVIRVSWTNTITASMAAATTVSPQISFEGLVGNYSTTGPNSNGTDIDVMQLDNIQLVADAAAPVAIHPVAHAGTDQVIIIPTSQITLVGSGSDNGSIVSYSWEQASGPNTATLSGQATTSLTASGLIAGTYVFTLTVMDNEGLSGVDEAVVQVVNDVNVAVLGETNIWHKITLALEGPSSTETATTNPFADYRMDVTFTHPSSGTTYTVPGYFAADGNAANSSASSGNKWCCHLRPNHAGTWNYTISFRQGSNVAMGTSSSGAAFSPYDGMNGSFEISSTNPTMAPDLRSKGRLGYVGKHHLQFEGNGEYFLKFGPDSPENFLEYYEFDNTPEVGNKGIRHTFAAHSGHYNNDGDLWQSTKGENILGAINYIASTGANSISMLLNNIGRTVVDPNNPDKTLSAPGDGARAFPFISTNVADRLRYDCSKLAQWEMVFDHTEKKGLYLHFKLAENEMARDLDGGALGSERKLYYREMVARFGHHLALNWNISEEIPVGSASRTEWLQHLQTIDPWQNLRVFHTGPSYDKSNFYNPHLGDSELTGVSLQTPEATTANFVFDETKTWVDASATANQKWVVACDEQGPGNIGVGGVFEESRKYVLWGNIMAGGAGVEYYWGGKDLALDDYSEFGPLLTWSSYTVNDFFYEENVPFWNMSNDDGLLSGNATAHCLTDAAGTYVVYLTDGGSASLNLAGETGAFDVRWFDPRNGGALQIASVASVSAGSAVALGNAPSAASEDWAVLIRKPGGSTNLPVAGPDVYPEADSYGLDANHATKPGTWNKLHIMGDESKRDSYFRFDLAALDGLDIDQVLFRVKVFSHFQPQTPTALIQSVSDDTWVEADLCWTNVPAAGATLTNGIVPDVNEWLELDITDYILAELSGDGKASMQLTATSTHLINLHSREAALEEDRPHLSIVLNAQTKIGFAKFNEDYRLAGGADGDDDGDGQKNLMEYALGGNPTNGVEMGKMHLAFTTDQNGHFFVPQFKDPDAAGIGYEVECKTNLVGGIWQPLSVNGMFTNDISGSEEMAEVEYRFWSGTGAPVEQYMRLKVDVLN